MLQSFVWEYIPSYSKNVRRLDMVSEGENLKKVSIGFETVPALFSSLPLFQRKTEEDGKLNMLEVWFLCFLSYCFPPRCSSTGLYSLFLDCIFHAHSVDFLSCFFKKRKTRPFALSKSRWEKYLRNTWFWLMCWKFCWMRLFLQVQYLFKSLFLVFIFRYAALASYVCILSFLGLLFAARNVRVQRDLGRIYLHASRVLFENRERSWFATNVFKMYWFFFM